MKTKTLFLCLLCAATVMFHSCSKEETPEPEDGQQDEQVEDPTIPEDPGDSDDEDLVPNSQTVSYDNAVTITFSSEGAEVVNPYSEAGLTIDNSTSHVVITSTVDTEFNYIISGITSDGSVKIYGEKKFGLVLNGVGITNPAGAAINIQNKKKCTLTIVDQTNNRLIDGATYVATTGEDMKGTFFSEGNVEISGGGNLEIRGKYKHAFATDGALTVYGGTINIKEAASDGIHANDEVTIAGGDITIRAAGDGIQSEHATKPIAITGGDITITTTGQKGHGIKTDAADVNIDTDGAIEITVYGNASKGINSTGNVNIAAGDLTINTTGDAYWDTDDISSAAGIKCDGEFLMDAGTLTILSTGKGGKGISADGDLTINGGTITVTTTGDQYVYNSSNDTAAKAIKSDGNVTVNGGKITIRTSKTEAEGLESKATLLITGGELDIQAYDDCINATSHIGISGGTVYCVSAANDAIDSNSTLTISGGTVITAGSEDGFDCDQSRFEISGSAIVVGVGTGTSNPTASACTQRSVVFNTTTSNVQIIRIQTTTGGNEVLTFKMPKTYSQRMTMLFSSPSLAASTGYTVYTGGTISGGTNTYGLYTGASYSGGSSAGSFTTGSAAGAVSTVGNSSNPGPR